MPQQNTWPPSRTTYRRQTLANVIVFTKMPGVYPLNCQSVSKQRLFSTCFVFCLISTTEHSISLPPQHLPGLLACLLESNYVTAKLSILGQDTLALSVAVLPVRSQGAHIGSRYLHKDLLLPRPCRTFYFVPTSALESCAPYFLSVIMTAT